MKVRAVKPDLFPSRSSQAQAGGKDSAVFVLTDFEEDAVRGFRMDESDLRAARTVARLLVDHLHALCHEVSDRVLDVVDAKSDVLDAASAAVLLDELRDRARRLRRREKLDLRTVRRRVEARLDLLLGNNFLARARNAQLLRPELADLVEIVDSNADVVYTHNFEHVDYLLDIERSAVT